MFFAHPYHSWERGLNENTNAGRPVPMDRYSRKIVGWNLDVHMREELVLKALQNAVDRYKPSHGLIVHSDRG